ncbi:class I SAM-dependent methyltransferase [Parvibaculum sp.]|uniref:class I SAM-dependent methyltransferase n=1 Tax=Parvibaculum sp. TaxID=2024848 RepID=UPI0034A05F36
MKDYGPGTFGELNADDYDALHDPGTTEAAVALLAELAGGGRVLELAIGTGRVALPLAERGLAIEGVEASPEMVAKLRAKPGGESIPVVIGDMADVPVEGSFDFVFLTFNTLFNLTSQDAQLRCFANVAKHLKPGGAFLVEAFVPDVAQFRDHRSLKPVHLDFGSLTLEAAIHDPVTQVIEYQYIRMTPDGTRLTPLPMRYAWPAEIDLMAKLAGLERENRWGGWDRSAFTAKSEMHVSVYRKPRG